MKILHIIPSYYPAFAHGGPPWSVHNLNKWLIKQGVDVTVYTTNINGNSTLDVEPGVPVDQDGVTTYYFPQSLLGLWSYSYPLHKKLKKTAKDFDLIHITSTFLFASTLGAYYAKKNNVPYIISPRGNLMKEPLNQKSALKKIFYIGLIEEKNLQNASAIHFTVPKEKKEYKEQGFSYNNSIMIPNGIDPETFKEAEPGLFRKKFNIPEDKKIVLFLSRLAWKKGLDTLIPAFKKVSEQNPNSILVIAGKENKYKKKILKMIASNNLKLDKDVIFTGMITGEDKTAAFQDSDVFVLSSYSENFGMAVAEAMNFGLPVVITENIGIASEIKKRDAGIVTVKDKDLVANNILKILQNPEFARDIGQRGRKLVGEKYLMSAIADRWVEEYQKLIYRN